MPQNKLKVRDFLQKSSVSIYKPPPCECIGEVGMDACIVGYPKDFCECSESCKFVSNYFVQGDHNEDRTELDKTEVLSMKKFSRLITPIPGMDDELDFLEPREGGKQVMNFVRHSVTYYLKRRQSVENAPLS